MLIYPRDVYVFGANGKAGMGAAIGGDNSALTTWSSGSNYVCPQLIDHLCV